MLAGVCGWPFEAEGAGDSGQIPEFNIVCLIGTSRLVSVLWFCQVRPAPVTGEDD